MRSQGMLGKDAPYVPGWDCHGLPIEWKIEEQYRAEGKSKEDVPTDQLRRDCRVFASHWLKIQREQIQAPGPDRRFRAALYHHEFPRRGGDRARGDEVRGERIALSRLPPGDVVAGGEDRAGRCRDRISREVLARDLCEIPDRQRRPRRQFCGDLDHHALDHSRQPRHRLFAGNLLRALPDRRRRRWLAGARGRTNPAGRSSGRGSRQAGQDDAEPGAHGRAGRTCRPRSAAHPFRSLGYDFEVPLLAGAHVTAEAGTGFVHTAPGHGEDDFELVRHRPIPAMRPKIPTPSAWSNRTAPMVRMCLISRAGKSSPPKARMATPMAR